MTPRTAAPRSRGSGGARGKPPKIQRLVDLIAALLTPHNTLRSFEQILDTVPAYRGKSEATQKRMFERDKLELRAFGVPIETVGEEGSEESAYKLVSRDFYLPYLTLATPRGRAAPRRVDRYGYRALTTLTFEPDELAAVARAAAAARGLGDPNLRADVDAAMRKLAFDLPVDAVSQEEDEARVLAQGARAAPQVLAALGEALLARKRVTFNYHSMGSDVRAQRTVEPYGLFFLNGHWYLAARDAAKDALRNFRVSRIAAVRTNAARAGTPDYEIPADFHLREHARSRQPWELGDGDAVTAVVEFRGESGPARVAESLGRMVPGAPRLREFSVRRPDAFARWLLSFAGEAVLLEPPTLVGEFRALVARTRAVYTDPGEGA